MTPSNSRAAADKGNMVSAGIGSGDRVAIGGEHAAFERRAILARSPHQPYAAKMDRERELKIIRRAYAKQVTGCRRRRSGDTDARSRIWALGFLQLDGFQCPKPLQLLLKGRGWSGCEGNNRPRFGTMLHLGFMV
jgi:hypothetical protein